VSQDSSYDIVICGAGIAGIAVAYYLSTVQGISNILLVDKRPVMTLTSDKSGECYRNWWSHPTMTQLINHSIDLMDEMALQSNNFFHLNRQGYAYVSEKPQSAQLEHFVNLPVGNIRIHDNVSSSDYQPTQNYDGDLTGADVLQNRNLFEQYFPHLSDAIDTLIHVRRAGWLSAQQLGAYMLEAARAGGLQEIRGKVSNIEVDSDGISAIIIQQESEQKRIETRTFVNATGPYANHIAAMMGESLPIYNILHQKVVFQDIHGIVPRNAPFTIYLDEQFLDWSDEERNFLQDNPEDQWLLEKFPGGLHIRPEGGADSNWIKLGWAFNNIKEEAPSDEPQLPQSFPDIVVRGATRMIPDLKKYINQIPTPIMYDGGFYTRTEENMPIISPMNTKGAYVIGALSGFGIMAACAAGDTLALQIVGNEIDSYASQFLLSRYDNPDYLSDALTYASGEL
jgi:glycine/D-amino acid oxidase-like deaminating enzyme